jgi:hypothetical protein
VVEFRLRHVIVTRGEIALDVVTRLKSRNLQNQKRSEPNNTHWEAVAAFISLLRKGRTNESSRPLMSSTWSGADPVGVLRRVYEHEQQKKIGFHLHYW